MPSKSITFNCLNNFSLKSQQPSKQKKSACFEKHMQTHTLSQFPCVLGTPAKAWRVSVYVCVLAMPQGERDGERRGIALPSHLIKLRKSIPLKRVL